MPLLAELPERDRSEDKAHGLIQRLNRLQTNRGNFEAQWEEVAARVLPAYVGSFYGQRDQQETQGQKNTSELYDSSAGIALERFTAILDSLLSPADKIWARLAPSDRSLLRDRDTALWFEEATHILFQELYRPGSGFLGQNQQTWASIGAFGTGSILVTADPSSMGLRFSFRSLGETYMAENAAGVIDTVFSVFWLSARQAAQEFGVQALSDAARSELIKNADRRSKYLHAVYPRSDADPDRIDWRSSPYASCYVDVREGKIVQENGYAGFPFGVSRHWQAAGEVYGRSPAMAVLPGIKTLNEQKKTVLIHGQMAVAPAYLLHDDSIMDASSIFPGGMIAGGITADGRPLVQPLHPGDLRIGKDLMDDERADIKAAFLVDLFQILVETPTMTATEVEERSAEKATLLAPTVGRQHDEYQGPLISRAIDLLMRMGKLPPLPRRLQEAGGDYTIVYESPLSRAAMAQEVAATARTFELAAMMANATQDPSALDWFNADEIVPAVAAAKGVPTRFLHTLEDVQAIREARAQKATEQTAIQAAPGAAAMMKPVAMMMGAGQKARMK